jgi:hypothetical protein
MDHYYETIGENWFSYAKFYKDMVEKFPSESLFVELGSWRGRSSVCMLVEIINSGKNIKFDCVDEWKYHPDTQQPVSNQEEFDEIFYEFLNNIQPVNQYIQVVKMSTELASSFYTDNSIDFVFVDAGHSYAGVLNDLKCWYPKLKKGGIIAGHDYFHREHTGVREAVDEFYNSKAIIIKDQNVWYYEK